MDEKLSCKFAIERIHETATSADVLATTKPTNMFCLNNLSLNSEQERALRAWTSSSQRQKTEATLQVGTFSAGTAIG
jgi:hypothetical protein